MSKLLLLLPLLAACHPQPKYWQAAIQDYDYSYQTSQVQETTHDIRLAVCQDDIYIAIEEDYNKSYVSLKYTGNYIYYRVYKVDNKVSNKGWERR